MKIETFRGGQDFFGPLNGISDSEGHFGANKVSPVSRILEGTGTVGSYRTVMV